MAIVKITYDTADHGDNWMYQLANNSQNMYRALHDVHEYLYRTLKHDDLKKCERKVIDDICQHFNNILSDNSLTELI